MSAYEYEASKDAARANRAFYAAFERLDLVAMRAVWLAHDSVKCIHPGHDLIIGHAAVMASWAAIFENTESIALDITDVVVEVVADLAWVSNFESVRSRAGGGVAAGRVVATNLFQFKDEAWRMILHHASTVPQRPSA